MTTVPAGTDIRTIGSATVVRAPALVRGELRMPAWPRVGEVRAAVGSRGRVVGPTVDGSLLVPRPLMDRETLAPDGGVQVFVVPAVEPHELPEPDPAGATRELMDVSLSEVCAFVDAVGARLRVGPDGRSAGLDAATSSVDDRWHAASRAAVTGMFDGDGLRRMVEVELGEELTAALDGWAPLESRVSSGVTVRMASRHDDLRAGPGGRSTPMVRGLPTTQLHVTAGNAPVVPATSLLWGWASKGACVVKPAADLIALAADLAVAVAGVDHPLARHTTIAYWPGGDARTEEALLRPGTFERTIVWGSVDAIRSIAGRTPTSDLVVMRPRHAVSLLSAGADDLVDAARRATADSVVADQRACMSSLVHVVEGRLEDADAYADVVRRVLDDWDERLPHRISDGVLGELHNLRRGLLANADWRVNGRWPRPRSAVVRLDHDFDLERHPGGRVVVVRAVPDVRAALPRLVAGDVSHVGVSAALLTDSLRDDLAALGVDNILPLGDAEQTYAGRPHDGMRVVTRLVRWVNG